MDQENGDNEELSADEYQLIDGDVHDLLTSDDDDEDYHSPVYHDHDLSDSEDVWDETQQPMDEDSLITAAVESAAGSLAATAFDINKAGLHEYLGTNLDEVSGFTFYEENSIQKLPIVEHQTVSFPGQKMPFNMFHHSLIAMVMNVMDGDKTYGLVADLHHYDKNYEGCVGVTFQVMNCSPVVEGRCQLTGLCRQRFKVIEATRNNEVVLNATVRILPEKQIVPFYSSITSNSNDRTSNERKRKLNASIQTPFPTFVYEQYNEKTLVNAIHKMLRDMCSGQDSPTTQPPSDPLQLSYWVAHNLPLVDQQRMLLLKLDCPVQRLRWQMSFMAKCSRICCSTCGQEVSSTSAVFSMNTEGPQGSYVNPDGFVHDTLTVRHANNLVPRGVPSARFSWFPGYKWVCVFCHSCFAHVGWHFEAVGRLAPQRFWGLTRKALITMPHQQQGDAPHGSNLRPIL